MTRDGLPKDGGIAMTIANRHGYHLCQLSLRNVWSFSGFFHSEVETVDHATPGHSSGSTYESDEEDRIRMHANQQLESLLDRITECLHP